MKAITVKYLPQTTHLPARVKAMAAGVRPMIDSICDDTAEETARKTAIKMCDKYKWGKNLAEGQDYLGNWVFCFIN